MNRSSTKIGIIAVIDIKVCGSTKHEVGHCISGECTREIRDRASRTAAILMVDTLHIPASEADTMVAKNHRDRVACCNRLIIADCIICAGIESAVDEDSRRYHRCGSEVHFAAVVLQALAEDRKPWSDPTHEISACFIDESRRDKPHVVGYQILLSHDVVSIAKSRVARRIRKWIVLVCVQLEITNADLLFRRKVVITFDDVLPLILRGASCCAVTQAISRIVRRETLIDDIHCDGVKPGRRNDVSGESYSSRRINNWLTGGAEIAGTFCRAGQQDTAHERCGSQT